MFSITKIMDKVSSVLSTANDIENKIQKITVNTPPIMLGNIKLELVSDVNETYANDVPMTTLDDGSVIADNISIQPFEISFKVQVTGADHKEVFEKILELRNKRELVDLYLIKLYKNMAITSIEKGTESAFYTEFDITLTEVRIAHIQAIPAPSIKAKPVVSKTTKIKTNTSDTTKDWEGELESEKIKLPGEK